MSLIDRIIRDPRWVLAQVVSDYHAATAGTGVPPSLFEDRLLATVEDLPDVTPERISRRIGVPIDDVRGWLDAARCRRGG